MIRFMATCGIAVMVAGAVTFGVGMLADQPQLNDTVVAQETAEPPAAETTAGEATGASEGEDTPWLAIGLGIAVAVLLVLLVISLLSRGSSQA